MILSRIQILKLRKISNIKCYRQYSTRKYLQENMRNIRNIGIMAHIDAGKTTTTERMLYFSGLIKQMGEVHHGNTVTDYMEQERNRGITIKSAAVTFPWKKHHFNLIDTPGHIDFTMEVEQALNVMDGAILILDGSAGVEAQTLTVWRQAQKYNIPSIAFVNKMDRADANYKMSCDSISEKLDIQALPLQIPYKQSGKLLGVIDVLTQEKIMYSDDKDNSLTKSNITHEDGAILNEINIARSKLIDIVSEHDDCLANIIIEKETIDNIKTSDIVPAIARAMTSQKLIPVLCGSAYKNIGVQPLMDSVILYLPSPEKQSKKFDAFKENLAARAFKVLHDKQKGPLVFLRIYNGVLNRGQKLFNMDKNSSEQTTKLLMAHANDFDEVETVGCGNIAVVTGLKQTIAGDFITNSVGSAQQARGKPGVDELLNVSRVTVPDAVFFCSIEPPSLTFQAPLDQALLELQREDPSIRVTHAEDTGQTVLAGMGELHLEIIKDRILKEYKIDADLGPLQISYREAALSSVREDFVYETKIGSSKQTVNISISLVPTNGEVKDILKFDKSPDAASNLANLYPKHLNAIRQGVEIGLAHGAKVGAPIIGVQLILHHFSIGRGTTESVISATTTQCIRKLLEKSGTAIMEPIMNLEVILPEEHLSAVMADLGRKRATIQNVTVKGKNKMVVAETPLSELVGYSTTIRTLTSGTGVFSMQFLEYKDVGIHEDNVIASVRGF